MTGKEIANEILTSNLSQEDLKSIFNAYSSAHKLNREREKAVALASVRVGMEGKLKNIRPKSYIGRKVVVTKVNRSRIEVKETGDGYRPVFTVPANCIEFEA